MTTHNAEEPVIEPCDRCGGSGLVLDIHGEPTDCGQCSMQWPSVVMIGIDLGHPDGDKSVVVSRDGNDHWQEEKHHEG